ncbi:MAG: GNAT family N-acetyltransferase [Planctomycetaceae bacterium]
MDNEFKIRPAAVRDYPLLGEVLFDAVRNGPSPYSDTQRLMWAPAPRNGQDWERRLKSQTVMVAESKTDIVGFMSLTADGVIDFAYLRPSFRGYGLFRRLYESIEEAAIAARRPTLTVHASLMAEPAFSKMGFTVCRRESIDLADETLDRFLMQKHLSVVTMQFSH